MLCSLLIGSLWVSNWIPSFLQNSANSGGTTQQDARLIWMIPGLTLAHSWSCIKSWVSTSLNPITLIFPDPTKSSKTSHVALTEFKETGSPSEWPENVTTNESNVSVPVSCNPVDYCQSSKTWFHACVENDTHTFLYSSDQVPFILRTEKHLQANLEFLTIHVFLTGRLVIDWDLQIRKRFKTFQFDHPLMLFFQKIYSYLNKASFFLRFTILPNARFEALIHLKKANYYIQNSNTRNTRPPLLLLD